MINHTPEPRRNGPTTLTPKRIELNDYYQDAVGLDNFFENKFPIYAWEQIAKEYPNAWRNMMILRDSVRTVIDKMEEGR